MKTNDGMETEKLSFWEQLKCNLWLVVLVGGFLLAGLTLGYGRPSLRDDVEKLAKLSPAAQVAVVLEFPMTLLGMAALMNGFVLIKRTTVHEASGLEDDKEDED